MFIIEITFYKSNYFFSVASAHAAEKPVKKLEGTGESKSGWGASSGH
jgi:hypothetical protein